MGKFLNIIQSDKKASTLYLVKNLLDLQYLWGDIE